MSVYYRHLTVNFNSYIGIKQPNMTDIQTSETIEAWLKLLPSLKSLGLHI